jgi:hypothetical protein
VSPLCLCGETFSPQRHRDHSDHSDSPGLILPSAAVMVSRLKRVRVSIYPNWLRRKGFANNQAAENGSDFAVPHAWR